MIFVSLKRIIRSGWIGLVRQGGLTIATVFTMVMVIFLVTSLFLFRALTHFSINYLQEKIDISVYFKNDSTEKEILKIKDEISKLPEVKEINYISDQEAKKRLIEKQPNLAESLKETEGMLNLASLNIKAASAEQYVAIVNFLENAYFKDLIKEIDYSQRKPIIEKIFSITSTINKIGLILSLILGGIAFLLAFNQIKLAINNSCEEIFIQRLVGASNWFIRGPFLIQGIASGFFAALIVALIFLPLVYFLSPKMEAFFAGFNLLNYYQTNFFYILLIQILTGVGLGLFSSYIAMRKHLQI